MDTSAKIACCAICLLSDAMKDCNRCAFRVGLAAKTVKATVTKESTEFLQSDIKVTAEINLNIISA